MKSRVNEFIDILRDNRVIIKRYERETIKSDDPRFDNFTFNEDLLISELELCDEELLEYIEFELTDNSVGTSVLLNGYSQPSNLEDFLEGEFEKFRIELRKKFSGIEKSILREIIQEVKYSRNQLEYMHNVNRSNRYLVFDNLISTKMDFCAEAIRYINMSLVGLPTEATSTHEYHYSILPEMAAKRHYILYDIHRYLKAKGYIDCTSDVFKNVFTTKEPKPIKWYKSQRSLTYMIKIMTGKLLVEKSNPTNAYITEKYFHIYRNGILFHPKKVRHDKNPKPEVKEFFDHLIDNAIQSYL